jgi:hypothetical protein
LKKLSFSSYTRPESAIGAPVVKTILKMVNNCPSFLLLYELLANQASLVVLPGDEPCDLGTFLFYLVGNENISGVQNLILKVMCAYPAIANQMPAFEDKRRLKLPKFTGLDVYQAHLKSAASFIQENVTQAKIFEIQTLLPQYRPPNIVNAAKTIDASYDYLEGRCWLNPQVRDFKGAKRTVSHTVIPPILKTLSTYLTAKEVTYLVGTPLHSIDLKQFVDLKNLVSRNLDIVDSKFPISVLNHPSSQSYIARVSVTRLEQDLKDFSQDENAALSPVLKFVNNTVTFEGQGLVQAVNQVSKLIASLNTLRQNDNIIVKNGIEEIISFANGEYSAQSGNAKALRHILLQKARSESILVICLIYCVIVLYKQVYGRGGWYTELVYCPSCYLALAI